MFVYIKNGVVWKYPFSPSNLREQYTNVSFPTDFTQELLAEYGVYPVIKTDQPDFFPNNQKVVEISPELVNGNWTQQWLVVSLTPEEQQEAIARVKQEIVYATQARLDAFARTRGYDDIKSASDYAGCSVPQFSLEGQYCKDKRAETWAKLYEILAEVQAGTRPMPTGYDDIEPELPALVWPT